MMVLLEYLTDTAVAPLQRDFVELSEPYCSNVCLICCLSFNVYPLTVFKNVFDLLSFEVISVDSLMILPSPIRPIICIW